MPETIDDLCAKARGDVEIIAVLDGYWPERISDDKRVHYLHWTKGRGMRAALNAGVELARGDFVMKLDAHCMVSEGFDVVLAETCQENWVCVPQRHRLDPENWCINDNGRPPINYLYIDLSNDGLNGKYWRKKCADRSLDAVRVDDIIICQGSCYFMRKAHWQRLGLLDEANYGTFRKDPQEVFFKTWTSGGRCVRVKDAWYAHLHKGRKYGRMYHLDKTDYHKGDEYVKAWWTDSAWDERQTIPLGKVFARFPDMPGWQDHPWMRNAALTPPPPPATETPLVSICIPAMNRTDDLRQIMPHLILAANASPPVEIVIVDYSSSDGLGEFVQHVQASGMLNGGSLLTYSRYEGRDTYHMAHARNLSVKASHGDYVLISSSDIVITAAYLDAIRAQIAQGCVWTYPAQRYKGVICVRRDEFEAAGGFDERFEWYGKEDKDLHQRLLRRGAQAGTVTAALSVIPTPWEKKKRNYRGHPSRSEMHRATLEIYRENCAAGVLVANEGQEWGSWE